jgi:CHAT domain-containing protein
MGPHKPRGLVTCIGSRIFTRVSFPVVLILILLSCRRQPSPEEAFQHAYESFLHGDFPASQAEAEKGYRKFGQSNPRLAQRFRILEAEGLEWRGMSLEALDLVNPLPESQDQAAEISILTLKAVAHARLHQFNESEDNLQRAEKLCAATSQGCGAVLRARGVLAMEQGEYARAEGYFNQSLAFARAHGDRFLEATALLNLGTASLQQNHFDEAVDWSSSARELSIQLGAGYVAQVALGNLGWAYYQLGDAERALDMFLQAEKSARQFRAVHVQLIWLMAAGYVYLDRGDYSLAEQSYLQGLDLAEQIKGKEDVLTALMSLALVSDQMGKLSPAREYAERAIQMARGDGNRSDELYPLLVEGRVAAKQNDSTRAENIFREVASDPKSDVSLKWEAEHSLAKLYEGENRPGEAEREYRAALKTFETARSELKHEESALPFLTNASRIYDDYVHFLVARGRSAEALQVADFTRARTLAEGLGQLRKGASLTPSALDAQAVAGRARGSVLFYWLGEKHSYLWAITAKKTAIFTLPSRAEIDAAVRRYERGLVGPQDVLETANRDGSWLYTTLVAPAASLLGKNGRVLIIPDGSLNGLNFETLLAPGERLHYWIEDATISDASSLRLLHAPATSTSNAKLLMIGNPLAAGSEYGALPNAGLEMDKIENHFAEGERTVYARAGATAASYLASKPGQFSYIHFVAHGTASRTSPLDSAVVLSPSGKQEDPFKLYARDVIGCPLHARLVTISTCFGAGTRAYTGEGLVGLSWAFLRAGAHNVVGALWEVNDSSTPQLMDRFYAELTAGESPDVALRAAKLSLLNSNNAFRRPYYWGPFQMYSGM